MFGRRGRMGRPRPLRRLARAVGLLEPRPRQMVNEAHALEAAGRHAEAAALFAQVADLAAQHGVLDRAGNLSLQASRCLLNGGDAAGALARARTGLNLLVQAGREHRAAMSFQMAVDALRAQGHAAEAAALQKEFTSLAQTAAADEPDDEPAARGHLPPKCVNCGGPLRPGDVDWIDDATAECPYCGSAVRAGS
ncbi:MAG: hypothetical protein HZB53_04500 [Chloroflexi bacterium]|nr:hypothetical protein [Chloroflexota bacterium]